MAKKKTTKSVEKKTATESAMEIAFRKLAKDVGKLEDDKIDFFLTCKKFKMQIDMKVESYYDQYNLSAGRFQILLILLCAENHAMSPSELADQTGVSRASMTQFLDAIEKAGYIERKAVANDRRAMMIQITDWGLKTLKKDILPAYFNRCRHFSGVCTKAEMAKFAELYSRISQHLSDLDGKKI